MKGNWPLIGAVVVLVLGYLDLVQHYPDSTAVILPAAVARAVPMLIARRAPLVAAGLAYLACAGTAFAQIPSGFSTGEPWPWAVTSVLVLGVMAWVLGVRRVRRDTALFVALIAVTGIGLAPMEEDAAAWTSVIGTAMLVAAAAAMGDWRSGLRGQVVEEREQRVALEERARIAREMHDIVAHHMSMVAVSAETAPYRIPDLPDSARAELADIAGTARASLTEMRKLLGVLRGGPPELAPQPGIASLDALVAGVRGVPVTLDCEVGSVPDSVGLAAYRIVQEGLSNVIRHAPGAPTTVSVRQDGETVVVEVTNQAPQPAPIQLGATPHRPPNARATVAHTPADGPLVGRVPGDRDPTNSAPADRSPALELADRALADRVPADPAPTGRAPSGGHGLLGVRERVAMLDGTLDIDRPDGGYRLRAVLPLGDP
ncbi:MAG TPA: histidine kinase [Actinokineospora sp.]|jgi:signal transduction histidine kinase|nr:histidine kinase [Actinokineospora sp.]